MRGQVALTPSADGSRKINRNIALVEVSLPRRRISKGKYLHPELFATSQEKAIGYSAPPPSTMAIPEQVASTISRPIIEANSQ